jgi:hypothetical protein
VALNIKENSKMASMMVMDNLLGQMEILTKDSTKKVREMVLEQSRSETSSTQVTGVKEFVRVMVL